MPHDKEQKVEPSWDNPFRSCLAPIVAMCGAVLAIAATVKLFQVWF